MNKNRNLIWGESAPETGVIYSFSKKEVLADSVAISRSCNQLEVPRRGLRKFRSGILVKIEGNMAFFTGYKISLGKPDRKRKYQFVLPLEPVAVMV